MKAAEGERERERDRLRERNAKQLGVCKVTRNKR